MLNIPMYSLVLGGGGGKDVDMPSDCQNLGGGGGAQAYPSHAIAYVVCISKYTRWRLNLPRQTCQSLQRVPFQRTGIHIHMDQNRSV